MQCTAIAEIVCSHLLVVRKGDLVTLKLWEAVFFSFLSFFLKESLVELENSLFVLALLVLWENAAQGHETIHPTAVRLGT